MQLLVRYRKQAIAVGGALLVGLIVWIVWPKSDPVPPPRERTYKAQTACLLTDDRGVFADPAKSAWDGMRDASEKNLVKVQYLTITGPQTSANGLAFFNSLALQKCVVIVAVGDVPVASMVEGAAKFNDIRYVTVGGDPKGIKSDKIEVTSMQAVREATKQLLAGIA